MTTDNNQPRGRKFAPWTCPRCRKVVPAQYPALSRLDNDTEICNACGTDEAMRDHLDALEGGR